MKKRFCFTRDWKFSGLIKLLKVMKLTVFLLLVSVAGVFANKSYSQSKMLNLDMHGATVKEVIKNIEEQSEFYFLYSENLIDVERKVNVTVENEKIDQTLSLVFNGTDVDYSIRDRIIVLTTPEMLKRELGALQQQKSVSGKVTDEKGEPLPGVTVIVTGTTIGITTDFDGNYSLEIPADSKSLTFSFVGMRSQEIEIGNRTTIDVTMVVDAIGLEEVVAVGYGSVSRKNLTTSISKVSTDEITKSSNSNMSQLMLGRAAGLQATIQSAQPGGNVDISIRGAGNPIYIIDGVMMPNSSLETSSGGSMTVIPSSVNRSGLAGLNPDDIESVEVLKDASASIYGIGAANGVILITTKKGKKGPLSVKYNGSFSLVENTKYVQPLNAPDYMNLVNVYNKEQYLYNNAMVPYGSTPYDNGWSPAFSDTEISNAQSTDWLGEVLRSGSISNHNINITGGGERIQYYTSGNYFKQKGTVSNSEMERYSLRSKIDFQLNSFINLSSTVNVNRNFYLNSSVGGTSNGRGAQAAGALTAALAYPSNVPVKDENGDYSVFINLPNAVAMEDIEDNTNSDGTYLNFVADIKLIKNILSAKLLYGNNKENTKRSVFIPSYVYFDQMYKSRGNLGTDSRENQTMEATLAFDKSFNDFLTLNVVAGIGKYLNSGYGLNVAYDEQHDAIANDNLRAATGIITPGSYRYDDEKRSQFIRANIDILDRYVVATTIRRDGTDKFFPDSKYAIFPSVSMAWKISNESFLEDVSWLNLLKIRASYGETGSDNLGSTLYGTYGPFGSQVMFNNNSTKYIPIVLNGLDYPDVSWQKTTMKNIGIDFYILGDRVSGSFDLFRNDITDMLGEANTAGLSMFGSYPINGAHTRRQGWDASLNTKNIQTADFTWSSILNLSRYNALWIERMPNYDYNEYEIQGRVAMNADYYYETSGLINVDMSNVPSSQPESARYPGFPIIVDQNDDGEITVDDIVMNNNVPDLYLGFGNTFTYKNFDLDIFMYSQLGVNKRNWAWDWASPTELANQGANSNEYAMGIWNSQTNPDGRFPGIAYSLASVTLPGGAGTNIGNQNASFLRVRNITLGYNLSGNKLGEVGKYISNIRVYVDAQNPILITNFEGFDPEVYSGGDYKGGKGEYPQTRTFSAGVNISF